MRLHDCAADRKADAQARPLGGVEGLEDALGIDRSDPGAGIRDSHHQLCVCALVHRDRQHFASSARGLHGVDRVTHKIQHDLLNLDLVGHDLWQVAGDVDFDAQLRRPAAHLHQLHGGGYQLAQIDRRGLGLALLEHGPQALQDCPRTRCLCADLLQQLVELVRVQHPAPSRRRPAIA